MGEPPEKGDKQYEENKKFFAALLTLAMVLRMSMSTFAAPNSITIRISGAGSGATFEWLQVVKPNSAKETGWEFATSDIASDFYDALDTQDEQTAIWMLIGNATPNTTLPTGVSAATASQVADAMQNVKDGNYDLNMTGNGSTVEVSDEGVYYIEGSEPGYSYNPMAAYVSFGYTDGTPSGLNCAGVTAKRVPEGITKDATTNGDNDVTEINKTVTYTVTPSSVPYIAANELNGAKYILKDSISGATYVTNQDGNVPLTIIIGSNDPITTYVGVIANSNQDTNEYSFEADLSNLLKDNQYANQTIRITYQAVVKGTVVNNDVSLGDGENDSEYGFSSENLYTATINLVKYAADDNNNDISDNEPLQNAEFKVYKLDGSTKMYAVATNGVFDHWTKAESEGSTFTTNEEGKISLSGLDAGEYYFVETKAPAGYSKVTEPAKITISRPSTDAEGILTNSINFFNDTLAALPSTGGIGTTIFITGGCVLMIVAAGLFLASRRKERK